MDTEKSWLYPFGLGYDMLMQAMNYLANGEDYTSFFIFSKSEKPNKI